MSPGHHGSLPGIIMYSRYTGRHLPSSGLRVAFHAGKAWFGGSCPLSPGLGLSHDAPALAFIPDTQRCGCGPVEGLPGPSNHDRTDPLPIMLPWLLLMASFSQSHALGRFNLWSPQRHRAFP